MENVDKIKIFSPDYPIRDHLSLTAGETPAYIEWVKTGNTKINAFANESAYKAIEDNINYCLLVEPRIYHQKLYSDIENTDFKNRFKYIFTFDRQMLKQPNAKFLIWAGMWYGRWSGGGELDPESYKTKTKNISFLASEKRILPMHIARYNLAKRLDSDERVDCYGGFRQGVGFVKVAETLTDYRYSIIIEADIIDEWFTEKLVNCFGSMTIPIYWGAKSIDKYFNTDGIIQVNSEEEIMAVLDKCTEEDYMSRVEAMKDNYNRAMDYRCFEDIFYRMYRREIEEDNK